MIDHGLKLLQAARVLNDAYESLSPDTRASVARALMAAEEYVRDIERQNASLRKPNMKHCASCTDAQCWGVHVPKVQP